MFKKIYILAAVVLVLASCRGTKYTSQTKKPTPKPKTERPVATKPKPATPKPTQSSENLEATSNVTVYADVVKNYIEQYKEIAKDNMRNHGIPASITLAQGILESGAGNGKLAKEANNHFGIKCHTNWTGDTIRHDDDAAQECFRKYRHASESFQDHSLFLTSRSRYNDLFKLKKDDYEGWAKGLRKAGYATDPKYPDKLISLIERYELYKHDEDVLGKKSKKKEPVTEEITEVASNGNTHRVEQGDTLYNISKRYNTTVDELKRLNKMSSNDISIGQVLRVK
jgi:flagellum-specific peptidoglycan hydrolase FlgJ